MLANLGLLDLQLQFLALTLYPRNHRLPRQRLLVGLRSLGQRLLLGMLRLLQQRQLAPFIRTHKVRRRECVNDVHLHDLHSVRVAGFTQRLAQFAGVLPRKVVDLIGADLAHHCSQGVLAGRLKHLVKVTGGDAVDEAVGIADCEGD